jgi:RNA binding exosome subunit
MKPVWLAVEAFCFPTESREKVRGAVELVAGAKPGETVAQGEFGEPIIIMQANAKGKAVDALLSRVRGTGLSAGMVGDDGVLEFRLDKQQAVLGRVARGDGLAVKVKFQSFPFDIRKIREEVSRLFA